MERRSEPRYMCADLVKVQIRDPEDNVEAVATLEDISASGACLNLDRAVREGADLEIVCSKCRLRGKVRYCRFVQIGWDVGVEFEQRGTWDPETFRPRHLLEVEVCSSPPPSPAPMDDGGELTAAARTAGHSAGPRP